MTKIVLDSNVTNIDSALGPYNNNFQKVEDELQNKVLYRDNPVGEPNAMNNPLDMNGNRIYNLPEPQSDHEPARVVDIGNSIIISQEALATANDALALVTATDAKADSIDAATLKKSANLSDVVSASVSRTNLGLGTAATQNSGTFLQTAGNLSDVPDKAVARTNLGLGTAAVENVGTFATASQGGKADTALQSVVGGTGIQVDNTNPQNPVISTNQAPGMGFLEQSKNLSDLTNVVTARTNLGLGTAALASITTSATDTTAGRALKVGDFGIGAKAAAPFATNIDDWLMPNGIYQVTDGTTGTLPEPYGSLFVCGSPGQDSASNWAQQFFLSTTGNVYYRSSTNLAAWTTWQKIYNTGNLPGALTGTATIPPVSGGSQDGNFTITPAHAGMFVRKYAANASTWTLAAGFPAGAAVTLVNFGGNITLVSSAGGLYYIDSAGNAIGGSSRTLAHGVTTVLNHNGDWVISGTGIS